MTTNKALIFKKIPKGLPIPGQDLTIETIPNITANTPAPHEGGITIQSLYASFDPYLRGRMRPANVVSYFRPILLNKPVDNDLIAKVIDSNNPNFKKGDLVIGYLPFQQFTVLDGEGVKNTGVRLLDNPLEIEDIRVFLGALGMPGMIINFISAAV